MSNEYLFLADALTHDETIMVPGYDEDGNPIMEEKVIQVDNYPYHMATQVGVLDEELVVLALHTESPLLPGDTLVTYRAADDAEATIVDGELFEQIRPFGNNPDGTATGVLLYAYLDGFPKRLFSNGKVYPADNEPFDIEFRHMWRGTYWGHRAEMVGDAEVRDPAQYSIGAYTDDTYETWIWPTTGAFVRGPSEWQVDSNGDPLEVWYKDSWDGYQPSEKEDWYVAVLNGPSIEGKATLLANQESARYLFWEHTQGWVPGPDEDWVDTGLTIIAQAGTLYRLSGVPSDLTIGQALRLGPTAETTLTGYWPVLLTPSDYIQIDPFVQITTGLSVWKWA